MAHLPFCFLASFETGLQQFAIRQVSNQRKIGGQKIEIGQTVERRPLHGVEDTIFQLPLETAYHKKLNLNRGPIAIAVAHGGEPSADRGLDAELFLKFTSQSRLGGFPCFHLAAGKLPLGAHRLVGATLAHKHFPPFAFPTQDEGRHDMANRPIRCAVPSLVQFANGRFHLLLSV